MTGNCTTLSLALKTQLSRVSRHSVPLPHLPIALSRLPATGGLIGIYPCTFTVQIRQLATGEHSLAPRAETGLPDPQTSMEKSTTARVGFVPRLFDPLVP
jgi:hypothetical protein